MSIVTAIKGALTKGGRMRVSLPFLTYEVRFDDLLSSKTADERIARLDQIRDDLDAAISAVVELKEEAVQSKDEAAVLRQTVSQLQQDKNTAETLLQVPEESLALHGIHPVVISFLAMLPSFFLAFFPRRIG